MVFLLLTLTNFKSSMHLDTSTDFMAGTEILAVSTSCFSFTTRDACVWITFFCATAVVIHGCRFFAQNLEVRLFSHNYLKGWFLRFIIFVGWMYFWCVLRQNDYLFKVLSDGSELCCHFSLILSFVEFPPSFLEALLILSYLLSLSNNFIGKRIYPNRQKDGVLLHKALFS